MSGDTSSQLPVVEMFGPTFQGEGPNCGRHAVFIRLAGCNLRCAACDTRYAWDRASHDLDATTTPMTAHQIIEALANLQGDGPSWNLVVITGGEPLLHQSSPEFSAFVKDLTNAGIPVQIETNGTIRPAPWLVDDGWVTFVVSPKVCGPLATDPEQRRIKPRALDTFANDYQSAWKFVCSRPDDIATVAQLTQQHTIPPHRVWIMPEGTTPEAILTTGRLLAETVLHHGFNLSLRLHVLLWPGQSKGR